jgi:hypothetical protein
MIEPGVQRLGPFLPSSAFLFTIDLEVSTISALLLDQRLIARMLRYRHASNDRRPRAGGLRVSPP